MVCERGARFQRDQSTSLAPGLAEKLWAAGAKVDGTMFQSGISTLNIQDDHTALVNAGVPSVVLIDFDYPQFHTTQDTVKQCSAYTLGTVTKAVLEFLKAY